MVRFADEQENRVAAALLDLVKNTYFMDAVVITEVRIAKREEGWLVMVKGDRGGRHLVAFYSARTYDAAVIEASTTADCGKATWLPDKWPPRK